MIRHIVFFSVKNPTDLQRAHDNLWNLAHIPGVARFEVGINAKHDSHSQEIDLVVYAEFDDEAALAAFKSHPVYHQTTNIVKPLRDLRFVADYDVMTLCPPK